MGVSLMGVDAPMMTVWNPMQDGVTAWAGIPQMDIPEPMKWYQNCTG